MVNVLVVLIDMSVLAAGFVVGWYIGVWVAKIGKIKNRNNK